MLVRSKLLYPFFMPRYIALLHSGGAPFNCRNEVLLRHRFLNVIFAQLSDFIRRFVFYHPPHGHESSVATEWSHVCSWIVVEKSSNLVQVHCVIQGDVLQGQSQQSFPWFLKRREIKSQMVLCNLGKKA